MRRKITHLGLLFVLMITALLGSASPSRAQAGDPYGLISAVNSLRAANGMPALEANSILMSVAQAHTDYQAAIGDVTHTGAGGTRPRDRAAAAGYGGGATFFISENIAGGTNLSIDEVISWWMGDAPHINTMLGANYRDIGAGVAESNGFVYYTIDVAYVAGGSSYVPPPTITPGGPTAMPIYMVQTGTPNPDGSIIHVVLPGQTLITIAIAYGVTVNQIKELNYLTGDIIYDGDKLVIRRAGTPEATATPTTTVTPTRAATATRAPTRTATSSPTAVLTDVSTPVGPAQTGASEANPDLVENILVMAIVGLAAGGVILMIVGSFMRRSYKGGEG